MCSYSWCTEKRARRARQRGIDRSVPPALRRIMKKKVQHCSVVLRMVSIHASETRNATCSAYGDVSTLPAALKSVLVGVHSCTPVHRTRLLACVPSQLSSPGSVHRRGVPAVRTKQAYFALATSVYGCLMDASSIEQSRKSGVARVFSGLLVRLWLPACLSLLSSYKGGVQAVAGWGCQHLLSLLALLGCCAARNNPFSFHVRPATETKSVPYDALPSVSFVAVHPRLVFVSLS